MAEIHNVTRIRAQTTIKYIDNITVVTTTRAKLWGVYCNFGTSSHTAVIEDKNASAMITLASNFAAGDNYEFPGILMDGITFNPDDAATAGQVIIMWSEVGP